MSKRPSENANWDRPKKRHSSVYHVPDDGRKVDLSKSRLYTKLESEVEEVIIELSNKPNEESLLASLHDVQVPALTKRRAPKYSKGYDRYYPNVLRRKNVKCKKVKAWKQVLAAALRAGGVTSNDGYESKHKADCAALLYRYRTDIHVRL